LFQKLAEVAKISKSYYAMLYLFPKNNKKTNTIFVAVPPVSIKFPYYI